MGSSMGWIQDRWHQVGGASSGTWLASASKETRADVFRSEIARMNRAVEETKDRWRTRQMDAAPTDVSLRWGDAQAEFGKHRERAV